MELVAEKVFFLVDRLYATESTMYKHRKTQIIEYFMYYQTKASVGHRQGVSPETYCPGSDPLRFEKPDIRVVRIRIWIVKFRIRITRKFSNGYLDPGIRVIGLKIYIDVGP